MNAVATIAMAELRQGLRNRWAAMAILLLAVLALALAFLGSAPVGTVDVSRFAVTTVSLASLSIYLVPLIALLLAYDAVIGEIERGTLPLLLTYPIARSRIVLGKFLGQVMVIALAVIVGYGIAGGAIALIDGVAEVDLAIYLRLVGSSVLLGAAFIALGHLASTAVRQRGTAAGIAIGLWLFLVLLYDMGLLGALVADESGVFARHVFPWLLVANPADAFRLVNLAGSESVAALAGMAGIDEAGFGTGTLLTAMSAWVVLPLVATALIFQRKEP